MGARIGVTGFLATALLAVGVTTPVDALLPAYSAPVISPAAIVGGGDGLDPTFGTNGRTSEIVTHGRSHWKELVADESGNLFAVSQTGYDSDVWVTRILEDGTVDVSYGTAGLATIIPPAGSSFFRAHSIATQPDGKLVLAGRYQADGDTWAYVLRLDEDGVPDSTFGDAGFAPFAFDLTAAQQAQYPPSSDGYLGHIGLDIGRVIALPNGDLAVPGHRDILRSGGTYLYRGDEIPFVAFISPNGQIRDRSGGIVADRHLNSDRVVVVPGPDGAAAPWSAVRVGVSLEDSSVVVAGLAFGTHGASEDLLSRVDSSGVLDSVWGSTPWLLPSGSFARSLTRSGSSILVGGQRKGPGNALDVDAFIAKLSLTGTPDALFGTDGFVLGDNHQTSLLVAAVEQDGSVVVSPAISSVDGFAERFSPSGVAVSAWREI